MDYGCGMQVVRSMERARGRAIDNRFRVSLPVHYDNSPGRGYAQVDNSTYIVV